MRIIVAIIVLLAVGIVLAASLLIGNRNLSSSELAQIKTNCAGCHGGVPAYNAAIIVHDRHTAFNCSVCHNGNSAAQTADNVHVGLRWLAIGLPIFALIVIFTNLLIINRKSKVN